MRIRTIPTLTDRDRARFASKVRINPASGCHEWRGTIRDNGYGSFYFAGSGYPAHRVAYVMAHGEPAPGLVIDHMCRNRGCVNPAHLRPLTLAENIRIGLAGASNAGKVLCPRGHALGGQNLIRSLLWAGRACRSCDIAARAARHKGLTGEERERFIQGRADLRYRELRTAQRGMAATAA